MSVNPENGPVTHSSPEHRRSVTHLDDAERLYKFLDQGGQIDTDYSQLSTDAHESGDFDVKVAVAEAGSLAIDRDLAKTDTIPGELIKESDDVLRMSFEELSEEGGYAIVRNVIDRMDQVEEDWGIAGWTDEELSGEVTLIPAEKLPLPEDIELRIENAIEASSFEPTPEVREALRGYYEDHYKLGAVLDKVISNQTHDLAVEDIDGLIDNHFLKETAKHVLSQESRADALYEAQGIIYEDLFTEVAIGLETIGEKEQIYAQDLAEKLRQAAVHEGVAYTYVSKQDGQQTYVWQDGVGRIPRSMSKDMLDPSRINLGNKSRQNDLWKDSRFAGQLEFHNTGQFGKLSREGFVLRSRTRQKQLKGSFYSQMGTVHSRAGGNMHSNLPHFSETYDYHNYKQQATRLGNASETDPASPATAALPLAEIIAIAPYARDAEYAVLTPRDQSVLEKITVNDKIGDIGSQGSDNHGIHGEDRVFMAGNQVDHVAEAVNYDLEFGMNGYILMTESEHASGLRVGHGYGYPKERIIPDIVNPKYIEVRSKHQEMTDDEFNAYFDELRKQARVEQAENIKQLQAESRNDPKYAGRVVMPLRRGVLEYEPEAKTEGARDRRTYRFKHIVQHAPLS